MERHKQLYRGSEVQSSWTGLILSSLTGPPLALYRTRPSSRSSLHCPLQDEALQTVLSTLPSTGRGPLHGPLHCPLLDQAPCTVS